MIKKSHQLRLQAWQNAAVSCGLEVMDNDLLQMRLRARTGALWVRMEICGDGSKSPRIAVVVPGPPDFIVLRVRPESAFPSEGEIEIGDEPFDSKFVIQGPPPMAFALLDAETRRLLLRLSTEARLEICLGELRASQDSDEKLLALLPRLLEIGQRLAQPADDVPRRLAENATHDPEAGVRFQNLLLLIREHPEKPETVEALRTACSDPKSQIRLRAAKELGAEGHEALLKLAESWENDTVSAEAVSLLGQKLPFDRASAILERAWSARRLQTVRACLKVLSHGGIAAAVDVLAQVMEQEEGELALAAVQALGATASPAAEPPLISALQRALQREERDLQMAVVDALGRTGTAAAVLPLKEAAGRSWFDRGLRRATRQAIADIQSRLQGAAPGQLSLAGAEAGQLSLAQAEAGQLSIATDSPSLGDREED